MKKPKILILEDESLVALELQHKMISWGYECPLTFHAGEDAIKWAKENSPDIILADVSLKGKLDGVETAAIIKEQLDIPVIFLSAHLQGDIIKKVVAVQPQCYLIKPLDNYELMINLQIALFHPDSPKFL